MGNRQVSGLITFTVYTRGVAPRHWVCGIIEKQETGLFSDRSQLALLNPLGVNSSSDVLVSNLQVAPTAVQSGWEAVSVSGVFDGVHRFDAVLNTRHVIDRHHVSVGNSWNAVYVGRDGLVHVLSIKFEVRSSTHTHTHTHTLHCLASLPPSLAHSLYSLCCFPPLFVVSSPDSCSFHSPAGGERVSEATVTVQDSEYE